MDTTSQGSFGGDSPNDNDCVGSHKSAKHKDKKSFVPAPASIISISIDRQSLGPVLYFVQLSHILKFNLVVLTGVVYPRSSHNQAEPEPCTYIVGAADQTFFRVDVTVLLFLFSSSKRPTYLHPEATCDNLENRSKYSNQADVSRPPPRACGLPSSSQLPSYPPQPSQSTSHPFTPPLSTNQHPTRNPSQTSSSNSQNDKTAARPATARAAI